MKSSLILAGVTVSTGLLVALTPGEGGAAVVKEQTAVKIKLLQALKSGHERKGDRVRFAVAADVKGPDKSVLIRKGTPAVGTILRSSSRKMFGQPGKLEFTIDYIKVAGQLRIPLRSTLTKAHGQNNMAATAAVAVLLTPVAFLVKGSEVTVKPGTEFTAYVDQATEVPLAFSAAKAVDAARRGTERQCVVRLRDGRTVTGVLESYQGGTYYVGTDLGRLQIPDQKVQSITMAP